MPRVPVHNVGSLGIIRDIPAHLLPPEAWSDGQNVRFEDNLAFKITGHKNVFGTPSGTPYWALATGNVANIFWIYASLTKLFATDGASHADLTRAVGGDYATTENLLWNGGLLAGIPVITNGVDVPQFQSALGLGTSFANLTNWPAGVLCNAIKAYKNFLVALNVTKSGAQFAHMVKWSHPAVPGSVPSTWDETDPTKDAGEVELTDALAGSILDGVNLRDILVIYKERSTWGMQFTGDINIFRFFNIFESRGLLTAGCAVSLPGGFHFVASGEEIFVHNGQNITHPFDNKWHRFINKTLDPDNFNRAFTVANPVSNEVWFCYPEVGAAWPTLAVVWNYRNDQIGVRELPEGISHIALGPIKETAGASGIWDSDTDTWDSDLTVWDEPTFIGFRAELLQSNKNTTALQKMNVTNTFAGSNMTSFLERTGIALAGTDRQGQPKADFERRKLLKRIWPKVTGGPIRVRVGAQEKLDDPIIWQPTQIFDPATQQYLDFAANGRLLAVRFESIDDVEWQLDGYDLEVEILGMF